MTKIETLVKLIDQSSINCHGVDCRECPFDGLANGTISCALLHLNDANAEGITIKKAIIDAVDEAREEETEPTVGQIWKRKSGFGDPVEITRIVNNLDGTKEVRYSMDDGRFMSGAILEDFLKRFEKCEPDRNTRIIPTSKTLSHTTPDHYRLNPEPIDVIKGWDLGFCLGNVLKYIARAGRKEGESRDKDLHKAMEYLRMELEDQE
ncbi:DUF3310 domain-containing protein [Faecalibaculum rodentium]|uniref:DUF3310 domain-containing protein n=1 Tax=Faecalibaculum rodentium TaxID=1702221 RepID=UPI0023F4A288|nr:DUF3310 domain-containing protein [Faecalibaculum rodentium]